MITDADVARKYLQLAANAEQRNLEFNLSLAAVKKLLKQDRCFYTGVHVRSDVGATHPHKKTFDRVDASKGYIKGNVVVCSHRFNVKKGSLTVKDIELLHNLLVKGE